jgi:hypothetical protein
MNHKDLKHPDNLRSFSNSGTLMRRTIMMNQDCVRHNHLNNQVSLYRKLMKQLAMKDYDWCSP